MRPLTLARALGQRYALPILVVASAVMIGLGKADTLIFERLRGSFQDTTAPVLELLSRPAAAIDNAVQWVTDIAAMHADNRRLRVENERLLQWQQAAQTLAAENARLRGLLNLTPEPAVFFVSAKVVATSGGSFVRSVLISAGSRDKLSRGQAAITGEGLVGRVAEVGERASRVLLMTDLNSRIPVLVESSRERSVLAGDNSDQPRLAYLPSRNPVRVGDRIVTSGHGGVFPPGIPVGVVASVAGGVARVEPFVELSRLDFVRVVDYGLAGVLPQPVPPASRKGRGAAGAPAEEPRS